MQTLSYDIEETINLFVKNKIFDLRGLSSRLIREAAMTNDYSKAELGVIAYSLHKLETKQHFTKSPKWGRIKQIIINYLNDALNSSRTNNSQKLLESLKNVIKNIIQIDNEIGNYAQNLYDKAKVKEASLAYSYGLSIPQAAALTGADQKELQSYIGFTTMHDEETEVKNINVRVKELRELLEG